MSKNTREREQKYMEGVYKTLEREREIAISNFDEKRGYVNSGAYEDQEASWGHAQLAKAGAELRSKEALYNLLYKNPYFGHVELENSNKEISHYFLSDCDCLEEAVLIDTLDDGGINVLIPFKQDKERPMFSLLFHFYRACKEEKRTVNGETYSPKSICQDTIDNRMLIDVVPLFPEDEEYINADELLEQILEENRNDPRLKNIISSLQRMQFDIIESDINTSFVVQGCAGSGKTQCLLHRLFFLRDFLSTDGWKHVLLLTPTQLFRSYSMELMKRFQLTSISNCSIADLYRSILNTFDERFKGRQYIFELSEEYLPDDYLKEIYTSENIEKIDKEISKAIREYTIAGCDAIREQMPETISAEYIGSLVRRIDREIRSFDKRESDLQMDKEYNQIRFDYEKTQKDIDSVQRTITRLETNYNQMCSSETEFDRLLGAVEEAEQEKKMWEKDREDRLLSEKKFCASLCEKSVLDDITIPWEYSRSIFRIEEMLSGDVFKQDEEYLQFLNDYVQQCRDDVSKALNKNQSVAQRRKYYFDRKAEIKQQINVAHQNEETLLTKRAKFERLLNEKVNAYEGEERERALQRKTLSEARYPLSRIESTIFEKEVWNALSPLKEKYGIKTIDVEKLDSGKMKESRILYKSDLLFYLMIYTKLKNGLEEDYSYICIDEGQDLHKADFDMLHQLYPNAVFNIFGDTEQVLHSNCGISSWKDETGIDSLYELEKNYRNTAAIVDFCNKKFDANMEYIGTVKEEQKPEILTNDTELRNAVLKEKISVILRNKEELTALCKVTGLSSESFEFLDTHAAQPQEKLIPCYSIFAAKGLEFTDVVVFPKNMTRNQQIVACTRAMRKLYYYEG